MIKNVARYIAANTSLVVNSTLFAGFRPSTAPDDCVAVLESTPDRRDSYLADKKEKSIQILARNDDTWVAKAWVETILNLFVGVENAGIALTGETDEGSFFVNAADGSGPGYLGEDEKGRHEHSGNMVLRVQNYT